MSPISEKEAKCMDDISNHSSERNFSEEGQDGRDSKMFNSLVSPEKIPVRCQITEEEAKKLEEQKRISLISMEIPNDEQMEEDELFSNLDIPDDHMDKRESFGRLTEKIKES
jgi:hypothetical protein